MIPITIMLSELGNIMGSDEMLEMFQCDESGVLLMLSLLARNRRHVFYPLSTLRYGVVEEHFLREYLDWISVW